MAERRSRPAPRAPRAPRVDPARLAAYEVLRAVRVEDGYANLVLPGVLRRHRLSGRDAAFTTELAAGTLRQRGTYDAVLGACVDRPLAKVQVKVLDALRLGCHQVLAMRVPDHAAISSTVDLVREIAGPGAAGFANGVLRAVARHDLDGWIETLGLDLAAATSHPSWVVDLLGAALGPAADELPALLAADNRPPRVTLVARPGRSAVAELPGTAGSWSAYAVVLEGGDPGSVPAVAQGRAGVQDEGSQLVAVALAEASLAGPDSLWVDLCAGPGGKAALLAALADERDAGLLALELAPHRAGLVRRSLSGAPGVLGILCGDGTRPPLAPGTADRVLVDAPCTGLGALRRRPEARWRRSPADLDALVVLQRALLTSALDLVRPGGVVVYATCSPVLAETAGVVSSVLESRDDVRLEPVGGTLAAIPDATGPLPGTIQLWPHRHGTDAMFVALLRRVSPVAR